MASSRSVAHLKAHAPETAHADFRNAQPGLDAAARACAAVDQGFAKWTARESDIRAAASRRSAATKSAARRLTLMVSRRSMFRSPKWQRSLALASQQIPRRFHSRSRGQHRAKRIAGSEARSGRRPVCRPVRPIPTSARGDNVVGRIHDLRRPDPRTSSNRDCMTLAAGDVNFKQRRPNGLEQIQCRAEPWIDFDEPNRIA